MKIGFSGLPLVILGCIGAPLLSQDAFTNDELGGFVYVSEPQGVPAPRYRKIELGLPAGFSQAQLLAVVDPQGTWSWRFGWFTYGKSNSRSVAVAMNEDSDGHLFVDVNRDKRFALEERFEPHSENPHRWQAALGAEFLAEDNQYEQFERSILVRQAEPPGLFEIATQGVMDGSVSVGGKRIRAIRVDRNSNGRWFDSADRILLDTNGDGRLDAIGERIGCDSLCRIQGRRFVLQSDEQGQRLELVELVGLGSLRCQLDLQSAAARVSELSGTMVSRAGVRVPIRTLDQPIECPVGEYRIESLELEVADGAVNYWFRFSSRDAGRHGIPVVAGQSTKVDLLGDVALTVNQSTVQHGADTTLTISPLLETSSGLYLSGGKTGRGRPTLENRLLVQSVCDSQVFDNSSTGFS